VNAGPVVARQECFQLRCDIDVVAARRGVRDWAKEIGLSVLDLTKVVTAASELARNALVHGGGGVMWLQVVQQAGGRKGLRLTFKDNGPGIAKVDLAMRDGYSSGGGMGIGLPGAKRLVNEFDLSSTPGEGTSVTIVRWKP
jgi:serine/threonine-protein kinase RsbT